MGWHHRAPPGLTQHLPMRAGTGWQRPAPSIGQSSSARHTDNLMTSYT